MSIPLLCQVPKILCLNLLEHNYFTKTITENTTFTFTNARNCMTFVLILTNAGSYTITWPNNVKWSTNSPPILSNTGIDILTFLTPDSGTTYYGNMSVIGVTS